MRNFFLGFLIFLITYAASFFRTGYQGALPNYISASKNISVTSFDVCIDPGEVSYFNELNGSSEGVISYEKRHYSFNSGYCTTNRDLLARGFGYLISYGYLFLILFFIKIAGWMGDFQAIIFFASLCHAFVSLQVLNLFTKKIEKKLFSIIYIFNPFVIYIISGSYYYSFLPVSGLAFLYIYSQIFSGKMQVNIIVNYFILMGFTVLIRPTLAPLYLFTLALFFFKNKENKYVNLFLISKSLIIIYFLYNISIYGPWHSALVGLDSYSWDNNIILSDINATDKISNYLSIPIKNYPLVLQIGVDNYINSAKDIVVNFYAENKFLYVRNLIFNIFCGFSFGYINISSGATYFSIFIGFIVSNLMIIKGYKLFLIAILMSMISYILYFPPIPAYNITSYMLVSFFLANFLGKSIK